jgi:hypothetical protein
MLSILPISCDSNPNLFYFLFALLSQALSLSQPWPSLLFRTIETGLSATKQRLEGSASTRLDTEGHLQHESEMIIIYVVCLLI